MEKCAAVSVITGRDFKMCGRQTGLYTGWKVMSLEFDLRFSVSSRKKKTEA